MKSRKPPVTDLIGVRGLLAFIKRPGRIFWINFLAGIARGFGFAIGFTILAGIALWLLGRAVDAPIIGQFIARIMKVVEQQRVMPYTP